MKRIDLVIILLLFGCGLSFISAFVYIINDIFYGDMIYGKEIVLLLLFGWVCYWISGYYIKKTSI